MVSSEYRELEGLARQSRNYWYKLQDKFPVRSCGLRLVNNKTIREWSYKGITMVGRPSENGKKLVPVNRDSREAKSLPPTYRVAPDFRSIGGRNGKTEFGPRLSQMTKNRAGRPWTTPSIEPHHQTANNAEVTYEQQTPYSLASHPFKRTNSTEADFYFFTHALNS